MMYICICVHQVLDLMYTNTFLKSITKKVSLEATGKGGEELMSLQECITRTDRMYPVGNIIISFSADSQAEQNQSSSVYVWKCRKST